MAGKRHKPGWIIAHPSQVDVLTAQGELIAEAVKTIAVTETACFRWRAEYGRVKSDQVKRLKGFELEDARLRRGSRRKRRSWPRRCVPHRRCRSGTRQITSIA